MRILLLCHSFNSLTQRLHVELRERRHEVTVEFDIHDSVTEAAAALFCPDVVIAPFLKRAIPESVWRRWKCLVVHPGIKGDRGPSALDWAILRGEREWGVTVLEANGILDGGDIWASRTFPMRETTKGSLYRNETSEAAVACILETLEKISAGNERPKRLDYSSSGIMGRPHLPVRKIDRAIDWAAQPSEEILRRIRSADGTPGAIGELRGEAFHFFDAHPEGSLQGAPGCPIAQRNGAVCIGTGDRSIWIGHLRRIRKENELPPLKLPAATILGKKKLAGVAELPPGAGQTYRDISYEEENGVGYLHFPFYNGAMGTEQCERLRLALRAAKLRPTRVLVLAGGADFWSNGIHLGVIENAPSSSDESWRNIQAMDDLVLEIIDTPRQMTVSALQGNAGAGGVFLALAADRVWARNGIVLNPHYKGMGNLYGSEYWTYLLPRRTGREKAAEIAQARLPVGTAEARRWELIDDAFGRDPRSFMQLAREQAGALAADPSFARLIEEKRRCRNQDETDKPLADYRREELERMKFNFFGFDPSYHVARYNFIRRVPKSRTPSYLAAHRRNSDKRR